MPALHRVQSTRGTIVAVLLIAGTVTLGGLVLALVNRPAGETPPVIGGVPAERAVSSSLVYIADIRRRAVEECSGTIVAPRLVLTAGHCVVSSRTGNLNSSSGYRVIAGKTSPRLPLLRVSRVIVYPGYENPTGPPGPDAGLLVLSHPISIRPQLLAPARGPLSLSGGQAAMILGWSRSLLPAKRTPLPANGTPLRKVQAKTELVSAGACATALKVGRPSFEFQPKNELCAEDPPSFRTGVCNGDSGGPLLLRTSNRVTVEIGIASSGAPSCSTREPAVYTRVSAVSPWVEEWVDRIRQ
jgi:secreted trypsin-like serine protease